jgi:hypothetical protein
METKIVRPWWAKTIQWVALISYLCVALYYFAFLPKYLSTGWTEGFTYILVAVGFSLLFISANLKLKKIKKDVSQFEKPNYLFDAYSMSGWTLLTVHFIAILLLPSSVKFVYYYVFALLGYLLLSQGYIAGTYLLVLFYLFSISYYKRIPDQNTFLNYMIVLSKITIMVYMSTFVYIDSKNRWNY